MAKSVVSQIRHPSEKSYGGIMLAFGIFIWLLVGFGIAATIYQEPLTAFVPLFYALLISGVLLFLAALYRAYAYGHFVLVGPNQYPNIHQMVVQGAQDLGLAKVPTTFIHSGSGTVNAYAMRLVGAPYVMVTSNLIDCQDDSQLRFIVGHELGHHAAGHLNFWKNLLKLPGHLIPFLGPAYSRARELTCDRVGAYVAQAPDSAKSSLAMLACGSARLNEGLNADEFMAQEKLVPPFFGWLHVIFSHYPRLTTRVMEVNRFLSSQKYLGASARTDLR